MVSIIDSMSLITLLDASLAYGHVALLDHASFSLGSRERVGLIGRNGTGKSSLLKILSGLERADDGQLHVQQGVRIAYVPQEPLLDPEHTIYEAVQEGLGTLLQLINDYTHSKGDLHSLQSQIEALDGWGWEQRVAETLQRLHLAPNARIASLSGGNRKRVALARALVTRPDVLLLDEPTNHLDIHHQMQLMQLISELPVTSIVAIHDLNHASMFCDSLIVMQKGQIVATGTPQDILSESLLWDVFRVKTKIEISPFHGKKHIHFIV